MISHRGNAVRRNHIEVDLTVKCVVAGAAKAELAGAIYITHLMSIDLKIREHHQANVMMMKALGHAVELHFVKGFVKGEDTK